MIDYPNAKINLGLHVVNKRDDGFHNIETVFYPLGFSDMLECVENKKYDRTEKCIFISHGLKITGNPLDNLIVKVYRLLDSDFDLPPVIAHLNKIIPMGAGLGGGSSDAAFMIKLLDRLFSLNLTAEKMENYASAVGSDCAFFIRNKPAYLFGKGHELEQFSLDLSGYHFILINTGAHSNTALAYKHARRREVFDERNNLKTIITQPVESWRKLLENDFERSVFLNIPELAEVKTWLYEQGAIYASMSGSGASMYGLFTSKPVLKGKWETAIVHYEKIK